MYWFGVWPDPLPDVYNLRETLARIVTIQISTLIIVSSWVSSRVYPLMAPCLAFLAPNSGLWMRLSNNFISQQTQNLKLIFSLIHMDSQMDFAKNWVLPQILSLKYMQKREFNSIFGQLICFYYVWTLFVDMSSENLASEIHCCYIWF